MTKTIKAVIGAGWFETHSCLSSTCPSALLYCARHDTCFDAAGRNHLLHLHLEDRTPDAWEKWAGRVRKFAVTRGRDSGGRMPCTPGCLGLDAPHLDCP